MAKSPDVFTTDESVIPLRLSSRPFISPELSPKTGVSEMPSDGSSFDSLTPLNHPKTQGFESELTEIRTTSDYMCRNTQEGLQEFRTCSASVKRKILAMERQITSLRSSFVEVDMGSKSSMVRAEEGNTGEPKREQQQLIALMKELQTVQELLQMKELEFEKREEENKDLKQDLSRLEQLAAEAARKRGEGCITCECHRCQLL